MTEEERVKQRQNLAVFVRVADQTCQEYEKVYEFTCPACQGEAIAIRHEARGLRARCKDCMLNAME